MQKCSSRHQSTTGAQINDLIKRHESKTSHRPEHVDYMAFAKHLFNIMLLPLEVLWLLLHLGEPLKVLRRTLQQCFQVGPFLKC